MQATRFQGLLLADGNIVYGLLEDIAGLCKPESNARVRENAHAALTAVLNAVRTQLESKLVSCLNFIGFSC